MSAVLFNQDGFLSRTDKSLFDEKQDEEKRIVRLKRSSNRQVDWYAMLTILKRSTGCTLKDIHAATGLSRAHLAKINTECEGFDSGDRALALLDVFLTNTQCDIPLLGDHHDV